LKRGFTSTGDKERRGSILFNQVVMQIRSDLDHVDTLLQLLQQRMIGKSEIPEDVRNWVYDTVLDKIYETHGKIRRLVEALNFNWVNIRRPLEEGLTILKHEYESVIWSSDFHSYFLSLHAAQKKYRSLIESFLSGLRRSIHEVGWAAATSITTIDYAIEHRKKFVGARDELDKARQALESKEWEEVTNHLRTAIDLAIKEKFGFIKISGMKTFVEEAKKNDLPLPSYDSLYYYYDMGSGRLHSGIVNPPFEAMQAVGFVAGFIDALDLMDVKQTTIDKFRMISKTAQ